MSIRLELKYKIVDIMFDFTEKYGVADSGISPNDAAKILAEILTECANEAKKQL